MSRVQVTCNSCFSELKIQPSGVLVRICIDDDSATLRYRCTVCEVIQLKSLEDRSVDLLLASGVRMEEWRHSEDIYLTHQGPLISHDDLIDFHAKLDDCDALVEFLV